MKEKQQRSGIIIIIIPLLFTLSLLFVQIYGEVTCGEYECLPGINEVAIGYDITTGTLRQDPNYQIFNLNFASTPLEWTNPVNNQQYYYPKSMKLTYNEEFNIETYLHRGISTYSKQLTQQLGVGASGCFSIIEENPFKTICLASSAQVKYAQQYMNNDETYMVNSLENNIYYSISVNPFGVEMNFTEKFLQAVEGLSGNYTDPSYATFVQQYGTHWVYQTDVGGQSNFLYFSNDEYGKSASDFTIAANAKLSFLKLKIGSAGVAFNIPGPSHDSQKNEIYQTIFLTGGNIKINQTTPNWYSQWIESTYQNPASIQQYVAPISQFIKDKNKAEILEEYIRSYILKQMFDSKVAPSYSTRLEVCPLNDDQNRFGAATIVASYYHDDDTDDDYNYNIIYPVRNNTQPCYSFYYSNSFDYQFSPSSFSSFLNQYNVSNNLIKDDNNNINSDNGNGENKNNDEQKMKMKDNKNDNNADDDDNSNDDDDKLKMNRLFESSPEIPTFKQLPPDHPFDHRTDKITAETSNVWLRNTNSHLQHDNHDTHPPHNINDNEDNNTKGGDKKDDDDDDERLNEKKKEKSSSSSSSHKLRMKKASKTRTSNEYMLGGVDSMGIGVDLMTGEKKFQSIFDFTYYEENKYVDPITNNIYYYPDQLSLIFIDKTNSESMIVTSSYEYANAITQSVNQSFHIPVFGMSHQVQSSQAVFDSNLCVLGLTSTQYIYYESFINFASLNLSAEFQTAIDELPIEYDEDALFRFLTIFGSSVITSAKYGGRALMQTTIDQSYFAATSDVNILNSISVMFDNFKLGVEYGTSTQESQLELSTSAFVEFNLEGGIFFNASYQNYQAWVDSIPSYPAQIAYTTSNLSDFISDVQKRNNFNLFLEKYYSINQLLNQPVPKTWVSISISTEFFSPVCDQAVSYFGGEEYVNNIEIDWDSYYRYVTPLFCAEFSWEYATSENKKKRSYHQYFEISNNTSNMIVDEDNSTKSMMIILKDEYGVTMKPIMIVSSEYQKAPRIKTLDFDLVERVGVKLNSYLICETGYFLNSFSAIYSDSDYSHFNALRQITNLPDNYCARFGF